MNNATRAAIEEAYALALEGRASESLRLLASLDADGPVELARARCLSGADGELLLESLADAPGPVQWRARLTLARRLHRVGDTARAAGLVKSVLEAHCDGAEPHADEGSLAKLISLEVEHLQRPTPAAELAESYTEEDLLALIELGREIGALTDPAEVLRAVVHEAIRLTGADRGFVVLGSEPFEFAAAENVDRSTIDEPAFEVSRSLIREVLRTGKIELITLAVLPESHPASRSLGVLGVRAVACVPIEGASGVAGVLYLDARERQTLLHPSRTPFLALLARQAAVALRNAHAHRHAAASLERAEETIRRHNTQSEHRVGYDAIVGASAPMQALYARLDRVIPSSEPVILQGETGTGKDLIARLIHDRGPRSAHEFVAVNCAGLAESLLESELFGHERGAFTGASRARAGLLEVAHRGTLFLDEIADMPPRMQGDLLRALQSGEVRRLGGRETIHVDLRIVVATNRDLEREVERGRFRQDLYYRLDVLKLVLPPLRDRVGDIPLLVAGLTERKIRFTERAMARLAAHSWPGNVRELGNLLRRIAAQGLELVDAGDLPVELRGPTAPSAAGTLERAEEQVIRRAMKESEGNKSRAAKLLGIDRKTLYAKLKRLGLL